MKNKDEWRPTKFVHRRGELIASRDRAHVAIGSRVLADLTGRAYGRSFGIYARGKLVDLGCGQAPLYAAYRKHISDAVCVDWPHSVHGGGYVDVVCDVNRDLPFGDRVFNTVILSDVLEHICDPGHLWGEMARVLTRGGMVLVSVPFYYKLHEVPHDYYRYTEYALRYLAESNGFRVRVLEALGGSPEVFADFVGKHVGRLPIFGTLLGLFVECVASAVARTRLGREVSLKTGRHFPLGYFVVAERV